ncbi:hypothetical protein OCHUTO_0724 [Orientia chuto str. Dubai]|uniref:Uncharacterized protein n=1 Tax=Orientia chuto str. Dubai TaxID=1359168 RepID=A0A0F3MIY8_9RICK|nr:hypothetical protein OCHUTO_0724 [Orientia chuto str. Dubai]
MSVATANKPFLHWVGGKRRIINKLLEHLPSGPYYFEVTNMLKIFNKFYALSITPL